MPLSRDIKFERPEGLFFLKDLLSKNGKIVPVWIIDRLHISDIAPYLKFLSEDEIKKSESFLFEKDRANYVVSRGVLKVLLSHYLDLKFEEIALEYGEFGKPGLSNNASLKFNVSHSKNLIAIVFNIGREIGIDLEKWDDSINHMEVAKIVFTDSEVKTLKALEPKERIPVFYKFWTRKEAFIKCAGYGLSMPIKLTAISIEKDSVTVIEKGHEPIDQLHGYCGLISFIPKEGYSAALALKEKSATIEYRNWADYKHLAP